NLGEAFSQGFDKGAPLLANAIAGSAPRIAGAFWHTFWNADPLAKVLIAGVAAHKLGGTKALGGLLSKGGKGGVLSTLGANPANAMWVRVVGGGAPGSTKGPTTIIGPDGKATGRPGPSKKPPKG